MRIIIIAVLIFAFHGVTAQKFYIEAGTGLSTPISTTLTPVSIGTDNLMSKEWIADISVGYIPKKSNTFITASVKYGYLSNCWYIYEHAITNLGKPLIITNKYSMLQFAIHIGKRYELKQSYFFDYKLGISYNSIEDADWDDHIEKREVTIPNNSGGLIYKYYLYPLGYRPKNISTTLGFSVGKKIGQKQKIEILLNTGANIGFIPVNVKIIFGNYTGNGFATVPIGSRMGDTSISNGTYFYLIPSIRCYF